MAFDVIEPRPYDAGANEFFESKRCGSSTEMQARWDALANGVTVLQSLAKAPWSVLYGRLSDRFGIAWIVDFGPGVA